MVDNMPLNMIKTKTGGQSIMDNPEIQTTLVIIHRKKTNKTKHKTES